MIKLNLNLHFVPFLLCSLSTFCGCNEVGNKPNNSSMHIENYLVYLLRECDSYISSSREGTDGEGSSAIALINSLLQSDDFSWRIEDLNGYGIEYSMYVSEAYLVSDEGLDSIEGYIAVCYEYNGVLHTSVLKEGCVARHQRDEMSEVFSNSFPIYHIRFGSSGNQVLQPNLVSPVAIESVEDMDWFARSNAEEEPHQP